MLSLTQPLPANDLYYKLMVKTGEKYLLTPFEYLKFCKTNLL